MYIYEIYLTPVVTFTGHNSIYIMIITLTYILVRLSFRPYWFVSMATFQVFPMATKLSIHIIIHNCFRGSRAGADPSCHWVRGRVHPGQVVTQRQTTRLTQAHSYRQIKCKLSINLHGFWTVGERLNTLNPKQTHREHAHNSQKDPSQHRTHCEETVLHHCADWLCII